MALPYQNRLKKEKDFANAFTRGRFVKSAFLSVRFVKNNLPHTRIAVIISNKTSRKAVIRNRIRRLITEFLRPLLPSMRRGYDIVITIYNSHVADKNTWRNEALVALRKSRLIS